jgi:hypothetical protein
VERRSSNPAVGVEETGQVIGAWWACSFLTIASPHVRFPKHSSSRSMHD